MGFSPRAKGLLLLPFEARLARVDSKTTEGGVVGAGGQLDAEGAIAHGHAFDHAGVGRIVACGGEQIEVAKQRLAFHRHAKGTGARSGLIQLVKMQPHIVGCRETGIS